MSSLTPSNVTGKIASALKAAMKVLIVDNKSAHLEHLKDLIVEKVGPCEFNLLDPREVLHRDIEAADLIVISGGRGRSIIKNPQTFKRLIDDITAQAKPTIGICLGAEAIATAYGGKLIEMPVRRAGNIPINLSKKLVSDFDEKHMVYEFHKWTIKSVASPIEVLATSKDGVEVLRHKTLPIWGMQFHPEVRRLDNQGHLIFDHILEHLKVKTHV